MCGIYSYIYDGVITSDKLKILKKNFNKIKHRGPDSTSSISLKKKNLSVFLGFHRLSIIGITKDSDRYLSDGNYYLICNGEIYNYKYLINKYSLKVKTDSDCEVILQLYINNKEIFPSLLEELDGVFSFILYDKKRNLLLSSRDRFGVRPLFYSKSKKYLEFSSEAKALSSNKAKPFPPGCLMTIKLKDKFNINILKWYKRGNAIHLNYISCKNIIKNLFIESVRKRLVSDRPIGFLVSGGLDSSLVASVANNLLGSTQTITTFSIGLPNSPDLIAARKVAKYLNSIHHEILISKEDILEAIPKVIYHNESYDITTTRASIPMYLISKYIKENTNIKVIFSGEGADELLGGYLYFHQAPDYFSFQNETIRLLDELYKYDVLRSDRTTSAWGLELRVPFLDASFVDFVTKIDPCYKMPISTKMEKLIMREAFEDFLPNEILYRQKEAFSDGVGYNSVKYLKDFAKEQHIDKPTEIQYGVYPKSEEALLYFNYFRKYYKNKINIYTEKYWMPKWNNNIDDPSATVLQNHMNNKFV